MHRQLVTREQLEQDDRFCIDPNALSSIIAHHSIYSYRLKNIKLGQIRRYKDKKLTSLADTDIYHYVTDPGSEENRQKYQVYCSNMENRKDNPNRSEALFDSLIDTFGKEAYDPQKGILVIDQYRCIVDGFHRSCIFLQHYGPDHVVKVLQLKYHTGHRIKLLSLLYSIKEIFGGTCKTSAHRSHTSHGA